MDKSKLRFPAALCFFVYSVIRIPYIVELFRMAKMWGWDFRIYSPLSLLPDLAAIFVVIGLILNKPIIAALGALGIIYPISFFGIVGGIEYYPLNYYLDIIFYIFLLIACLKPKNAVVWSSIAAVSKIIIVVLGAFDGDGIIIGEVLLMAGVLLLGMAFQTKKAPAKVVANATGTPAIATIGSETAIEKLTKLKQLLDDGIITQEEFEAKKKQLLGM